MRTIAVVLAGALLAGCHHTPVQTGPTPGSNDLAARNDSLARHRADSLAQLRRAETERLARAEAERLAREAAERRARQLAGLTDTLTRRTHFDFDQAVIRSEDRPLLERKLAILRANPWLKLTVAGHADARGSDEYNLVLGTRRAAAVRDFLVARGVSGEQLRIVSYGEERPLAWGNNEPDWALNRRDEYSPGAALDSLVAPVEGR